MSLSPPTKPRTCAQWVKKSLVLLLISIASAEIILKVFKCPIRLACVPIIQYPAITPITVLSLLLWSLSRVVVVVLTSLDQIFRSVLPSSEAVYLLLPSYTIALSVISQEVSRSINNVENSLEFDGRPGT